MPDPYVALAYDLLGKAEKPQTLSLPKWGRGHNIGGLSDFDDEKLRDIICHLTKKMTPDQWAGFDESVRIGWMKLALDARNTQLVELPQKSNFVPTEADLGILQALALRKSRCKTDALDVRGVGETVKKERLLRLEGEGLVDREEGVRSGWAITEAGRKFLG